MRKKVLLSAAGSTGIYLEIGNHEKAAVSGRVVAFMLKDANCVLARGVNFKTKFQLPAADDSGNVNAFLYSALSIPFALLFL